MNLHFWLSFSAGVLGGAFFLACASWFVGLLTRQAADAEYRMARVRGEIYHTAQPGKGD